MKKKYLSTIIATLVVIAGFAVVYASSKTIKYVDIGTTHNVADVPIIPGHNYSLGELEIKEPTYLPVGGTIFYDDGDNGATYKFYDSSKNEIVYTDLSSLNDAVYYTVDGSGSKDRFYVVAADSSQTDYKSEYGVNLGTNMYWGYDEVDTGSTGYGFGSGKTNAATVLAIEDTSTHNASYGTYQSIWDYLRVANAKKYGGCDDWFIGSVGELVKLRESQQVSAALFLDCELFMKDTPRILPIDDDIVFNNIKDTLLKAIFEPVFAADISPTYTLWSSSCRQNYDRKEFYIWDSTFQDWFPNYDSSRLSTVLIRTLLNKEPQEQSESQTAPDITFYIVNDKGDRQQFTAKAGQTWREWIESNNQDVVRIQTIYKRYEAITPKNADLITYTPVQLPESVIQEEKIYRFSVLPFEPEERDNDDGELIIIE